MAALRLLVDFWDMPRNLPLRTRRAHAFVAAKSRCLGMSQKSTCGALYPAKAGITARVSVVQRQGKFANKSVNGSWSHSHFLRICQKRHNGIKKETYNSPDGEGRYVILLKRVKSWVLGCSAKVDKRFSLRQRAAENGRSRSCKPNIQEFNKQRCERAPHST